MENASILTLITIALVTIAGMVITALFKLLNENTKAFRN